MKIFPPAPIWTINISDESLWFFFCPLFCMCLIQIKCAWKFILTYVFKRILTYKLPGTYLLDINWLRLPASSSISQHRSVDSQGLPVLVTGKRAEECSVLKLHVLLWIYSESELTLTWNLRNIGFIWGNY